MTLIKHQTKLSLKDPHLEYSFSKDELWSVIDTYFKTKGLVKHQLESFDELLNIKINKIISESPPIEIIYNLSSNESILHTVKFKNAYISKPQVIERDNTIVSLTPNEARLRNLTYESTIFVNIEYKQERVKEDTKTLISSKTEVINLCNIPIMVGSSYCITNSLPKKGLIELVECEYDQGGYFIINGSEKVLIAQERMATNNVYVFLNKTNNYVAEIRSIQEGEVKSANQILIKYVKPSKKNNIVNENVFRVCLPYIKKEIPLIILFKALGLINTEDIIKLIDKDNIDLLEPSIEESSIIVSTEQAIEYIGKRTIYTLDTKEKRLEFINKLFTKDILAHVDGQDINKKSIFIGYMTNKLILTIKGKRDLDDRDHWGNKRIDLSSNLIGGLFRSSLSKVTKEFKMIAEKNILLGKNISLSSDINKNIITRDIKYALSTGNWTVNKQKITKTGVSQVLSRLSYLSTLSHLRRIVAPIAKDGKSAKPRQLHNTSFGVCCVTGDTKILLSDNITMKKISEMNNDNAIITTCKDTLLEEPSKIYNFFKKENQDIFMVTTKSGRTLKCTSDHPLLIKNNNEFIWKLTGDCKEGDKVVIKHTIEEQEGNQTIYIDKEEFLKRNT
jgi:DNA-directed RNA polymerase II subunit RPB2